MSTQHRISPGFTDDSFKMLGLTVLTAGLYPLIWAARASQYLNSIARARVVPNWMIVTGATIFGLQGLLIVIGVESDRIQVLLLMYRISSLCDFAYMVIMVLLAFKLRQALHAVYARAGITGDTSALFTVLFGVLYINHAMRKAALNQQPRGSEQLA